MNDIRPCGNNEKWCENCVSKGKCDYTRSNMTREEAIKNIKEHCYFANLNPKAKKALDFAVKTLEQEPCEDAISRQAVLAIAGDSCLDLDNYEDTKEFCDVINDLPPVTPQPKTMHEKQADSEKYQKAYDDGYKGGYAQARFDFEPKTGHWEETDLFIYECSECHIGTSVATKDNFCPYCGAKMVESQESEE